ncbi:hypothetical protein AGABI2DRAFT_217958 [Agaricus bisporus var. bisporus H97]|uniref:hypothetical protein n=1 Tax=Agaricus bisporus var. bisporus (strain H97 / ATCC MYA-4626 / FGSC 10389) TaxID=936046 RepID=UPI00029F6334|nr:hypothetical protein AGABI2DRAFT_217958 [Agaricus bisporus var. bisporus H97]EKV48978.1 hypothetical protein AGABI2DRAFT_217958 [Agaricus bisporus var. bisporus H97]
MTSHVSYNAISRPARPVMHGSRRSSQATPRTKVLFLGLHRAGKSSIHHVLFKDLPPKQTFYLETTMRIMKYPIDTVIPLEIWDSPGNATPESIGIPIGQFRSLIFVIDIRDLYNQPITKLMDFVTAAYQSNPNINIEVFVHKSEKLPEDDKVENFRQIQERVTDRLLDHDYEGVQPNFYLTSVYDHSLREAFSRVLHKLIDSLPYLEDMLNVFCANSQSPKAFLYDTKSRLYIATDASPVDSAAHHLCCDYLEMLTSFGSLYKSAASATSSRHTQLASPENPTDSSALSAIGRSDPRTPTGQPTKAMFYPSAATSLHASTPGTTLTFHGITSSLALLALVPTAVYEGRRGLLEYNVVFFREGVQEICDVETEVREGG